MRRYRVRLTLLSVVYLIALFAIVIGATTTQRPWSFVIISVGVAVVVTVYVLILRTRRPAKAAPADADPDPVCPCGASDDGPHTLTCQES